MFKSHWDLIWEIRKKLNARNLVLFEVWHIRDINTACIFLVAIWFFGGLIISIFSAAPKQPKEKKPRKPKEDKPKKEKAPPKPKAAPKKKAAWDSGSESGGAGISGDDNLNSSANFEKKERDGIRRAAAAKSKYVEDSGSDSDMFA